MAVQSKRTTLLKPIPIKNKSIESPREFKRTLGNMKVKQVYACVDACSSMPTAISISFENRVTIAIGKNRQQMINIDLCKQRPHSRRFSRPKAQDTKVSKAVLTPISIPLANKFSTILPSPIPASFVGSFKLPMKTMFICSYTIIIKKQRMLGKPRLTYFFSL